jgi:hypothetical protein
MEETLENSRINRVDSILKLKEIMKMIATVNQSIPARNKSYLNEATEDIKTLCELLDY